MNDVLPSTVLNEAPSQISSAGDQWKKKKKKKKIQFFFEYSICVYLLVEKYHRKIGRFMRPIITDRQYFPVQV